MCGRAAQTGYAVHAAAQVLGVNVADEATAGASSSVYPAAGASAITEEASTNLNSEPNAASTSSSTRRDNYNLSPGMDAVVFWIDRNSNSDNQQQQQQRTTPALQMGPKVWGLVPRGGTQSSPLQAGNMAQHFSNLMFNARSDTLYEKPTFRRLAAAGKTCVIALDGFFEWKSELSSKKKQPYFVYRQKKQQSPTQKAQKAGQQQQQQQQQQEDQRPYLLMAGLWTSVPTGRQATEEDNDDNHGDPTRLDTFTILTTDACPSLRWLHSRMPVCIWDDQLAREWLERPSPAVHQKLVQQCAGNDNNKLDLLAWHAVTQEMTSMKFRSRDAIKALPKLKTLDSFFAKKTTPSDKKNNNNNNKSRNNKTGSVASVSAGTKRDAQQISSTSSSSSSSPQQPSTKKQSAKSTSTSGVKPKKGSIMNFFKPKEK